MEYRDYYKILGVPRTASQGEIKKAFRKLAREHHPDRNAGDKSAEQRFKDVNEANAVLGDPDKRKQYDALGPDWESFARAGAGAGAAGASAPWGAGRGGTGADPFGAGGPFGGFGGGSGNVRYEFRTSGDAGGFSDFFRMMFGGGNGGGGAAGGGGGLDDILTGLGDRPPVGHGSGRRAAPRRATGAEAAAELTLEEAFHGTTRVVELDGRRLEITIPRGVDTGNRVRLSGKGPDGSDLDVVVRVRPHPVFTRRGADVERELAVTLEEALIGAEVPVGTLKGQLVLTIPPGTQNGRTFRLTGQGMPRFRADGAGDLFVRTRVVLPTHLSPEAREAARRFLDLVDQSNPRTT